jgi:hypothetical protein
MIEKEPRNPHFKRSELMASNPSDLYDNDFTGLSQPKPPHPQRCGLVGWVVGAALALGLLGLAALWHFLGQGEVSARPQAPEPKANRKELAKNIFLEVQGETRRVIVKSSVCLREGQLEGLLCRKMTKEHEYILAADIDATLLHAALLAAGGKVGHPVQYEPKYAPATGSVIKITLQYQKDGKLVRVPAQQWLRSGKDGNKVLDQDWVFGGSIFVEPEEKGQPKIYLANQGDVVCVCNMEDAMLDLPVRSPTKLEDRIFTAFTDRIPPMDTAVEVIFEPVPEKKPAPREK